MGVKKFIKSVLSSLEIKKFELNGKKKSLKILLNKLKKRKVKILKKLKVEQNDKKKEALEEECDLINIHIKNGLKKLKELQEIE